jgi:predicted enzyme related to lactoylglutathione lyase
MPNPVVRWQIVSPQAEESTEFYRWLFGWTVNQDNRLGVRTLETGGGGPDGEVWPAPQADRPFVQLFVAVTDIDTCIDQAASLGATVIVPKTALPDGDVMAVLKDPTGLPFAVCTLAGR